MSVKALTWAWIHDLPAVEKLVLLALADHANAEHQCWPKVSTLERKTSLHKTTIHRALRALEAKGLLSKQSRKVKGIQWSNKYTLKVQVMVIPITVPGSTGVPPGVAEEYPGSSTGVLLESSIEPSLEPSVIGVPNMPPSVDEQAQENAKVSTDKELLALPNLAAIYRMTYAKYYGGFQKEITSLEVTLFKQMRVVLKPLDAKAILFTAVKYWSAFSSYLDNNTDAYKTPVRPDIGVLRQHIQAAANFHELQLTANKPIDVDDLLTEEPVIVQDLTNAVDSTEGLEKF